MDGFADWLSTGSFRPGACLYWLVILQPLWLALVLGIAAALQRSPLGRGSWIACACSLSVSILVIGLTEAWWWPEALSLLTSRANPTVIADPSGPSLFSLLLLSTMSTVTTAGFTLLARHRQDSHRLAWTLAAETALLTPLAILFAMDRDLLTWTRWYGLASWLLLALAAPVALGVKPSRTRSPLEPTQTNAPRYV
jgi:hypothetical protein